MTAGIPLFTHADPRAVIAYVATGNTVEAITAAQFLADVQRVAAQLPAAGQHVLNLCADRYRFIVGVLAAALRGKISLLPSTHTAESVRQMREFAPDVFCLRDAIDTAADLPQLQFPALERIEASPFVVPSLPATQTVACVFTSGSTGAPVAHAKSWMALTRSIEVEAQRLGMSDGRAYTVVATVPAQHMYGFESSVLLALHSGNAFWSGKPFYAADIADALAAVPMPRVLVSTPFHLRTLLAEPLEFPAVETVLSATAPLDGPLAEQLEARLHAPLLEIYGCTETGQLATRRPAVSADWYLFDGVQLQSAADTTFASGGHVAGCIALNDIIVPVDARHFRLAGRSADMVNIAGKRASLAQLNLQLLAIPGVIDGVFISPDADVPGALVRLAAIVVAPALDASAILRALRERIDPAFLPRPLYRVSELPRNAAGKLPKSAVQILLRQLGAPA